MVSVSLITASNIVYTTTLRVNYLYNCWTPVTSSFDRKRISWYDFVPEVISHCNDKLCCICKSVDIIYSHEIFIPDSHRIMKRIISRMFAMIILYHHATVRYHYDNKSFYCGELFWLSTFGDKETFLPDFWRNCRFIISRKFEKIFFLWNIHSYVMLWTDLELHHRVLPVLKELIYDSV